MPEGDIYFAILHSDVFPWISYGSNKSHKKMMKICISRYLCPNGNSEAHMSLVLDRLPMVTWFHLWTTLHPLLKLDDIPVFFPRNDILTLDFLWWSEIFFRQTASDHLYPAKAKAWASECAVTDMVGTQNVIKFKIYSWYFVPI